MRKILTFTLISVLAISCSHNRLTTKVNAQSSLEDVIENYIQKVGGKKEWSKIKSFKMTMIGKSNSKEAPVEHFMLKPYCYKMVFRFSNGERILTYNGETGKILDKGSWKKMPLDMQIEMREEPDFFDELIFYKEKNYKAKLERDSLINGLLYHKISLTKSERDVQYYYINQQNGLVEIIEEYSEEKKYSGILFKTTFSAYQKIENIFLPKEMSLFGNDKLLVDYEIKDVILNPKLTINDFTIK